ncbi:MAG: YheU family protein [Deltaproteobacteria bacterium]|nr:YheU family protein [Deltaproteobacteria bacterium]
MTAITIPHDQLSPEALQGLIEEFITRNGTDYGSREIALDQKVSQVMRQLQTGKIIIVFDETSRTCNIISADEPNLKNAY